MTNIDTVNEIYAAFGRGDIPAILERLADDIEWDQWADPGEARLRTPWLVPRSGRAEVAGFFEALGGLEFTRFEPSVVLEGEGHVAVLVSFDAKVVATGKSLTDEEVHLWRFDETGRVTAMRHYLDASRHLAALTTPEREETE